jgi:tetratricopeptide (TPR) repeat protein
MSLYLQYAPADAKAYFRRALINEKMRNYSAAIQDITNALRYAESETDSTVYLMHRIELHDTLAANDRKQLQFFQKGK